jgi:hypothetical protein
LTFDDAFPPQPLEMARWDPPDSLAFPEVAPPPVEAVILDAYYYYLIHPEDEPRPERRRSPRKAAVSDSPPDTTAAGWATVSGAAAAGDTTASDTVMSEAVAEPLPPVQVDLPPRQEDMLIRRARLDMQIAESILNMLEEEGSRGGKTRERLKAVRSFIQQTETAMERRDYQGAANLALKARSLAEAVFEGRP